MTAPVTIVSGLPRSGTSLMMQMLDAGGLEVFTDGARRADADNPRGYYELEAVKRTAADRAWVRAARGRAVKVIYRLLYELPAGERYRVIFMRRDLDEVLASQRAMLRRRGEGGAEVDERTLRRMFERELDEIRSWLDRHEGCTVLDVDYNALVRDPGPHVAAVDALLGGGLDRVAMAGAVRGELYRQRGGDRPSPRPPRDGG